MVVDADAMSRVVDILSSLEFNETGRYLAAGDNGGRVVLFQPEETRHRQEGMMLVTEGTEQPSNYRFFSEFQSHEAEFDYLNSTEIQERINCIQWLPSNPNCLFLLSANGRLIGGFQSVDKTIKLWKVSERHTGLIPCPLLDKKSSNPPESSIGIVAQNKRVYGHAHSFNINSLSCFSDGEVFLSSDDLRINLWNLEVSNQSFSPSCCLA